VQCTFRYVSALMHPNPYMEVLIMRKNDRLVKVLNKLCIGIDLHKDTMMICVLDPGTGEQRWERIACKCREKILEFFKALPRPHIVAIESVGFYRWLWELLEPIVDQLVLADATQCRALAGRRIKTDRDDAANVAELLACGRLPRAWAPPMPIAHLRDATRHRHYLSRQHARVLHRVKAIMAMLNRPGPDRLRAPSLHKYLAAQRHKIPAHFIEQMEMAYHELVLLEMHISKIDGRIKQMLEAQPQLQAMAQRLMSFPGVGPVIAATIIAEVGDFQRFEHRDAITRYAGLNPRLFSSADTLRTGAIAKAGSRTLRWALVQAAWVAVRCDPSIKAQWLKTKARNDGKRAIIAIARRLLRWMWAASRGQREYRRAAA
jgi:transposase